MSNNTNEAKNVLIDGIQQPEIPSDELWLFKNKDALNQVKQGLKDAKAGRVSSRGNSSEYVDDKKEGIE